MKFGRRVFLFTLATVATAAGIFRSRHSLKVFFEQSRLTDEQPRVGDNPFVRDQRSLVSVVGGKDIKEMTRRAVSLIGGFGRLEVKGKTVLVKPNVVGGKSHPTTTNPELVKAVAELLYEEGASKVYVGDMSALIRGGTSGNMELIGIAKAARDAGAETVFFEDHGWVQVKISGKYIHEVGITEWCFKVDRVVNLPVLKTHRYAGYSICLKNFVGATHFNQRPYLIDRAHWEEVVAELNLAFRPDLNIVDGTKTMVEGGPWEGRTEDTNLIMASGDRVACDVIGLGIIKSFGRWKPLESISPWQMRQVRRAVEIGLGARNKQEMELLTESLDGTPAFENLMERVRALV